jgi:hypothetical protein
VMFANTYQLLELMYQAHRENLINFKASFIHDV